MTSCLVVTLCLIVIWCVKDPGSHLVVGDSVSTVECLLPETGAWKVTQPMSTYRSRMGMAVLNGERSSIAMVLRAWQLYDWVLDCGYREAVCYT